MSIPRTVVASLLATAASVWTPGCLGDRCDPGQILSRGQCVTPTVDASTPDGGGDLAVAAEEGGPEIGGGDAATADTLAHNLGEACQNSQDCGGVAPFCVVMPGQSDGYCTIKDCTISPDSCPEGYTCMDISSYVPGKPNLCIKQ